MALYEGVASEVGGTVADGVVVDHLTEGVGATEAGAGVPTLLVDTGLVVVTVGVYDALWVAAVVGVADVVAEAGTNGAAALDATLGVETTRGRYTGVDLWPGCDLLPGGDGFGYFLTAGVRVPHEPCWAEAHGAVSVDLAEGVNAAGAGARVSAASADAGQVAAAVVVHGALRLATFPGVGLAEEARRAGTHWVVPAPDGTDGVGAAGGRLARVVGLGHTLHLRVALVPLAAATL